MRLLVGPPGSGKTSRALEEFASAAQQGKALFVVPTATMAEHVRHELARRGRHIRPSWVTTMAGLLRSLLPEARVAGAPELALVVELALAGRPDLFAGLRGSPGLSGALASAFEELAYAGVDSLQLESLVRFIALRPHPDLVALYPAVEQTLRQHGLRLRAQALLEAARRLAQNGAPWDAVWFDGFFLFSAAERELLRALSGVARVTLTLPEWEGARPVIEFFQKRRARVERLSPQRPRPQVTLISAASREHEVEEIALRLIEEHAAGRPWREMGVVLRNEEAYLAHFERVFYRTGIPWRAYFGRALRREPVFLLVRRFVDALRSGWEGEATLALLGSPACAAAGQMRANGLWASIVSQLPFRGLDRLARLAPAAARFLEPFANWPQLALPPRQWAARLRELCRLLAPPPSDRPLAEEELRDFRLRAAALREILDLAESAAGLLPEDPLPLPGFWQHLEAALQEARIYAEEIRRDAVHLLDVEESRQWELPVVFVCGLLEGEFPRRVQPDPLLPEGVRTALAAQGVDIRTRASLEAEERFLFEVARTRASSRLFLCWPDRNDNGDAQLRAFVLDQVQTEGAPKAVARRLAIRPSRVPQAPPRPRLAADDLLAALRQVHAHIAATAIESFLQCPFQFFAGRTLRLKEPEKLPSARLDSLFLGTLAHAILTEWHQRGGDIGLITEEMWDREARRKGIPEGYRALLAREAMKRNLRLFARQAGLQEGWQVELERDLRLRLAGVEIQGRADRVDTSADGRCVVYDFKYSSGSSVYQRQQREEAGLSIQGGLYAEALRQEGLQPESIQIVLLKNEIGRVVADTPEEVEGRIQTAVAAATGAIEGILAGRIEVNPADPDQCTWCSFRDACRLQQAAPAVLAATE
ncbi:MAG: PD-(D/E)XK nuclease family protein [Bryobacteraceae bacterium]|nr:PD-(D/E)XK nuclease family protein [Bryobacteraceae bacterium]